MKKIYSLLLALSPTLFVQAQAPVITGINGSGAVCSSPGAANGYTVIASNSPTSYNWLVTPSTGVLISGSGDIQNISFPNTNLTYTILCTASNASGPSNPGILMVTVFETPTITFSGNNSICQGSSTSLMASSTILYSASSSMSYNWSPSTGLNTTSSATVMASPLITTVYSLTLGLGNCVNTYQTTIFVAVCVGIETLSSHSDASLQTFPNPTNGIFIIKSNRNEKAIIINDLGQQVRELNLIANEDIEVRELEPGLYFILTSRTRKKIIVTR